ncbi:MBL fold metallo-hydrolase [Sneathiella sp. CAU 1612]|uniref:MBL fold metallo-hydrolase n=1 Tax=Sneathiella sedimenti TaxID=2816034 RepID=A0ABS3F746_9PROT|nr:MBL fold metallo-hydrolase [Sneathiella sedimenti]MBO0334349.1 MBL fold metallo-hydrolase [Sneathiella sedimenti]
MNPDVKAFFHKPTFTVSYVVSDPGSRKALIIDSVLDYANNSGRTSTTAADEIIDFIRAENLEVEWILETHVHADHLTAAPYLQEKLGGVIGIGGVVTSIQSTFKKVYNFGDDVPEDGSQFQRLFKDGETINVGGMTLEILETPGHTPACVSYKIGDAVFVGDTLFMPDYGTARCDFPGGDARTLYRSIRKILAFPPETRLFMCHDYGPNNRDFAWETTVAEQRATNIHIHDGIGEEEFVKMRTERDATLSMPVLIIPSIQVNMQAGHMPKAEGNGVSYLKVPLNAL